LSSRAGDATVSQLFQLPAEFFAGIVQLMALARRDNSEWGGGTIVTIYKKETSELPKNFDFESSPSTFPHPLASS
jgi:hypothetical protein